MKKIIIGIITLLFAGSLFAHGKEVASNVMKIKTPHTIKDVNIGTSTEVFMELDNMGTTAHQLIAAYSPVAEKVQLHTYYNKNHHEAMRQVTQINIKPHAQTDLKFGGFHVMLINIKKQLAKGDQVPITLIFKDGSHMLINAPVVS